jgi:8-oxo-dGTP diphosphatase
MAERYSLVVDVMLLLVRGRRVLLALRRGTGYADGMWNLPSGKLEADEDLVAAVIREAREEVGLEIQRSEPRMVTAVHHRNSEGEGRVGFFFEVVSKPELHGVPVNAEPWKCAGIAWSPIDCLPPNLHAYSRAGVVLYRRGLPFGLDGWEDDAVVTRA